MQSVESTETYSYGTSKDLVSEKEVIKWNNIIKRLTSMINFNYVVKENIKEHDPNWAQIPDHP